MWQHTAATEKCRLGIFLKQGCADPSAFAKLPPPQPATICLFPILTGNETQIGAWETWVLHLPSFAGPADGASSRQKQQSVTRWGSQLKIK